MDIALFISPSSVCASPSLATDSSRPQGHRTPAVPALPVRRGCPRRRIRHCHPEPEPVQRADMSPRRSPGSTAARCGRRCCRHYQRHATASQSTTASTTNVRNAETAQPHPARLYHLMHPLHFAGIRSRRKPLDTPAIQKVHERPISMVSMRTALAAHKRGVDRSPIAGESGCRML